MCMLTHTRTQIYIVGRERSIWVFVKYISNAYIYFKFSQVFYFGIKLKKNDVFSVIQCRIKYLKGTGNGEKYPDTLIGIKSIYQ